MPDSAESGASEVVTWLFVGDLLLQAAKKSIKTSEITIVYFKENSL
jgi:hypothetical protein